MKLVVPKVKIIPFCAVSARNFVWNEISVSMLGGLFALNELRVMLNHTKSGTERCVLVETLEDQPAGCVLQRQLENTPVNNFYLYSKSVRESGNLLTKSNQLDQLNKCRPASIAGQQVMSAMIPFSSLQWIWIVWMPTCPKCRVHHMDGIGCNNTIELAHRRVHGTPTCYHTLIGFKINISRHSEVGTSLYFLYFL